MSDDTNNAEAKLAWFKERTLTHVLRVKRNVLALVDSGFRVDKVALMEQVTQHDASKYREPEMRAYIDITWMYRCKRLGEPFESTDELRQAANAATLHHVTHNRHHPEYWAPSASINMDDRDAPPDEMVDGTAMPDVSLVEMCCDWVSMSQEKLGTNSAHEWAKANVNVRWKFTYEQINRIIETLDALESALGKHA